MLTFIVVLIMVLGLNTAVWGTIGLCRIVLQWSRGKRPRPVSGQVTVDDVAVLVAAHNEELVIASTIESALASGVPSHHVFVVSDGSSDRTAAIARGHGARVLE